MTTARYAFTVTDERTKAPIAGMDIYVYDQATGEAAVMTDDLGQPLTNPLVTDTFGFAYFNAVQNLYRADFYLDGRLRYKETNIVVGDSNVVLKGAPPVSGRAGKFLAYDADGSPIASTGTGADAGLRTDLAASNGADLVKYLPTGTGASAVTVDDALKETTFDLGFSTLQAAITAAAGKRIFINRSWTLTAAVSIPANTEVVLTPGVSVTQTTSNTSVFTLAATNGTLTGSGKVVGTNTEAGPTTAAVYVTGNDCTVRNVRVNSARIGIAVGPGAQQYAIDDNLIWGSKADGGISADIIIYGSSGAPTRRGRVTNNRCFGNSDTGISYNSNDGDLQAIIIGNIICPLNSDMTARVSYADTERRYGIVFSYNGGTPSTRIIANNLAIGCAYSGLYGAGATPPIGELAFNSNIALDCGFGMSAFDGTDASLRAGILLSTAGRVVGAGNMAIDCWTAGLKIIDNTGYTSNTASRVKLQCYVAGTKDPTVTAADARAVFLTGKPSGIDLDMYVIHGAGATGPAVSYDSTSVDAGDLRLSGSVFVTGAAGALQLAAIFGSSDINYPINVDGMVIHGSVKTSGEFNSGIWLQGNVNVRNVTIERFDRGVNNAGSTTTRRLDKAFQNITIRDTNFGIGAGGTGLLLVEGLSCTSVTTPVFGCFVAGTRSTDELGNTTINISSSVIPSSAFGSLAFARGDWSKNSLTASGAALGWGHNGTSWIAGPANP